jgi:hypothetical protein
MNLPKLTTSFPSHVNLHVYGKSLINIAFTITFIFQLFFKCPFQTSISFVIVFVTSPLKLPNVKVALAFAFY